MRALLWVFGALLLIVIVLAYGGNGDRSREIEPIVPAAAPAAPAARADPELAYRLRTLRDEAIANIGWVAGNAYGHLIWPELRPYIGRGGEYYDSFMRLAPPGADHQTEAALNVALYQKWFERGQAAPFNEPEGMRRLERLNALVGETTALLRQMRAG